jgi:hypothetical protein
MNMNARCLLVVSLLVGLVHASPASAAEASPCTVSFSGAVKGSFECKLLAIPRSDRSMRITLSPGQLPKKKVKATIPGEFEVPPPASAGTYPLHALVSGKAVITTSKHATYAASHDKGKPTTTGELTLTLTSVEAAKPHEPMAIHGTVKARLAPTDGGKGFIDYEVKF